MSASPDIRQALLRACADVLLLFESLEQTPLPCSETVCASRCSVRIEVRPADSRQTDTTQTDRQTGEIAGLIRKVLSAAEGPLKLVTIARRAGRDLTSHFRKVAYAMHAAGELVHHDGHRYSLRTR